MMSFCLHAGILSVLLASTSSQLRNNLGDSPAQIINNFQKSNLQEELEVEELKGINVNPVNNIQKSIEINEKPVFNTPSIISAKAIRRSNSSNVVKPSKGNFSSFFGTSGEGERICYVVDISGSMIMAIEYIKKELINSISKLEPNQHFQIIFYATDQPVVFSTDKFVRASYFDREAAITFINNIDVSAVPPGLEGWRPVAAAFRAGFDSRTDDLKYANLFYLFTDGDFDINIASSVLDSLQQRKSTPATINILQCGNPINEIFLKSLARKYKGEYKFLTDEELVRPPVKKAIPEFFQNSY